MVCCVSCTGVQNNLPCCLRCNFDFIAFFTGWGKEGWERHWNRNHDQSWYASLQIVVFTTRSTWVNHMYAIVHCEEWISQNLKNRVESRTFIEFINLLSYTKQTCTVTLAFVRLKNGVQVLKDTRRPAWFGIFRLKVQVESQKSFVQIIWTFVLFFDKPHLFSQISC